MANRKQANKRTAQNLNNSNLCTHVKSVKAKIPKPNTPIRVMEGREEAKETDMHEMKHCLEYAHAEIADLKKENETNKANQEQDRARINKLEKDKATLRYKIVDLQARSMRDNLLFFNILERDQENITEIIHELLESKMKIDDARKRIKIDRIGLIELVKKEKEIASHDRLWLNLTTTKTEDTCVLTRKSSKEQMSKYRSSSLKKLNV